MDNDLIFARYYNLSLRFLSYRPRSQKEVLDYLNEKSNKSPNLTPEIIDQIIKKLIEYSFIDDSAFLKFWFEQRTRYKRKPLKVVKFELTQKGISKVLIDDYFKALEDEKDIDLENARKLAEKKLDFYRNLDPKKRQEKVMNYLLRKGFNYDVVKKIFKS